MLDDLQKKTAMAIINVFETGQVVGDYGKVTLLPGDPGHLTYGRSQTTLASGNLFLLIKAYVAAEDAAFADQLEPFLERLERRDLTLDHDLTLRHLLREAGEDPVMREAQDGFFDRVYWAPALRSAEFIGAETPLGTTVVYDGRIHGSWHRLRDRTIERFGTLANLGEQAWIGHYVQTRLDWLAGHSIAILRRTTYRMTTFQALIGDGKWELPLPLRVRGLTLDAEALTAEPALRASAEVAETRLLRLLTPFLQGEDVRALQLALKDAGIVMEADGVFGPATERAVEQFQASKDLTKDGIVGPATRSMLGI